MKKPTLEQIAQARLDAEHILMGPVTAEMENLARVFQYFDQQKPTIDPKLKPHMRRFVVTPPQRKAWERFKEEQWPTESDPNFAEGSNWKECFMAGYKAGDTSTTHWRREYQAEANENYAIRVALGVDPQDPDETLSATAVERVLAERDLLRNLAVLVAGLKTGESYFRGLREDKQIDEIFAKLKALREEDE